MGARLWQGLSLVGSSTGNTSYIAFSAMARGTVEENVATYS
jgi:predicted Na+-dependent transporter